jgi:hypothetical protein
MSESSKHRPILRLVVSALNGAEDPHLQAALGQIAGQNAGFVINPQSQ